MSSVPMYVVRAGLVLHPNNNPDLPLYMRLTYNILQKRPANSRERPAIEQLTKEEANSRGWYSVRELADMLHMAHPSMAARLKAMSIAPVGEYKQRGGRVRVYDWRECDTSGVTVVGNGRRRSREDVRWAFYGVWCAEDGSSVKVECFSNRTQLVAWLNRTKHTAGTRRGYRIVNARACNVECQVMPQLKLAYLQQNGIEV